MPYIAIKRSPPEGLIYIRITHMTKVLLQTDPVTLRIPEDLRGAVQPLLQVIDTSADYQLSRLRRQAGWKAVQMGQEAFEQEVAALERRRARCLLFRDDLGLWTYSGLGSYLSERLGLPVKRQYDLPAPRPVPWAKTPQQVFGGPPHEHQVQGAEAAIRAGHGTCDFATGAGKTLLLAIYLRELGLRAAVVVWSRVIADQICGVLTTLLGAKYVGQYNGDKKQLGKLFTVCTGGSLKNLKPGSKEWEWFAGCQVLCGDESHMYGADVLCGIATGVFRAAPYRLFVSATQTRGDGLELLLRGVVGPTLCALPFREAVQKGFLAKPAFVMVNLDSDVEYFSRDPDRMTRAHLYESAKVAASVGELVRHFVGQGYACLVLAEEFPQVACLLRHLGDDVAVLHGGTGSYRLAVNLWHGPTIVGSPSSQHKTELGHRTLDELLLTWGDGAAPKRLFLEDVDGEERDFEIADVRMAEAAGQALLPRQYWDAETETVRRAFNSLEKRVVVSTSAGRVGVDFCPPVPMVLFYLAGGTSEIAYVQGVGRGSRRRGKEHFLVLDFRIRNVEALNRHADVRAALAEGLWERPAEMELADLLG